MAAVATALPIDMLVDAQSSIHCDITIATNEVYYSLQARLIILTIAQRAVIILAARRGRRLSTIINRLNLCFVLTASFPFHNIYQRIGLNL